METTGLVRALKNGTKWIIQSRVACFHVVFVCTWRNQKDFQIIEIEWRNDDKNTPRPSRPSNTDERNTKKMFGKFLLMQSPNRNASSVWIGEYMYCLDWVFTAFCRMNLFLKCILEAWDIHSHGILLRATWRQVDLSTNSPFNLAIVCEFCSVN